MHIMIDLETLSTRGNAHILEIGAVCFDREKVDMTRSFSSFVGDQAGRHIELSTVAWWMDAAGDAARKRIALGMQTAPPLGSVLDALQRWVGLAEGLEGVWARGAAFDMAILRDAYAQYGFPSTPWKFRAERDTRTLISLNPYLDEFKDLSEIRARETLGRPLIKHAALDDAVLEAHLIRTAVR